MESLQLVVTTVVRHAPLGQPSGYVYLVDFLNKRTLMRRPVPESRFRFKDANPRGGLRGAKGVSVFGDRLVVANTDSLTVFDPTWKVAAKLSDPLMGGVHDVLAEEDGIWVTCTHADLLLKLDWSGRRLSCWTWRQATKLAAELGFQHPPAFDGSRDYRDPDSKRGGVRNIVHLNAVSRGSEGLLLSFGRVLSTEAYRKQMVESFLTKVALAFRLRRWAHASPFHALERLRVPGLRGKFYGSRSCLVLLRPDGTTKILRWDNQALEPNHNVVQVGPRMVYNDTNNHRVVAVGVGPKRDERRVTIPGAPPFVRGLAHLRDQVMLVGSQAPTAIYAVDLATGRIESSCELKSGREAVYAIACLPFVSEPSETGLPS